MKITKSELKNVILQEVKKLERVDMLKRNLKLINEALEHPENLNEEEIDELFGGLKKVFQRGGEKVGQAAQSAGSGIAQGVKSAASGVAQGVKGAGQALAGAGQAVAGAAKGAGQAVAGAAQKAGQDIKQTYQAGEKEALGNKIKSLTQQYEKQYGKLNLAEGKKKILKQK